MAFGFGLSNEEIESIQAKEWRQLYFFGSVSFLAWGLLIRVAFPELVEPLWLRFAICAIPLSFLLWTKNKSVSNAVYEAIGSALALSFAVYLSWMGHINHWHGVYSIGLVIVCGSALLLLSDQKLKWIYFTAYSLLSFTPFLAEQTIVSSWIVCLGSITGLVTGARVSSMRNFLIQRLVSMEHRSSTVVTTISEGIGILGSDRKAVAANESLMKILKLDKSEIIGNSPSDTKLTICYEDGKPYQPQDIPSEVVFRTGQAQHNVPLKLIHADGTETWILENAIPIFHPKTKEVSGVVISVNDVSAIKKAESALRDQQATALRSGNLAALGEMAAGVAHEINNPLAIIIGRVASIRSKMKKGILQPDDLNTGLERIEATSMRIARIVDSMRTLSRNEDNDPVSSTFALSVVNDTLDLSREFIEKHGVRLQVVCPSEISLKCRPGQVGQLLLNLLSNAKDAVRDSQEKWIRLEVCEKGEFVEFSVTDSGPGIPPHVREKLMQPFFTTKPVGSGTGLGLSIARKVAAFHKAKFYLDEKSPHTRFVLLTPMSPDVAEQRSAA